MGAFSTIKITRSAARKYLLCRIMEADDVDLGDTLDLFLSARLYTADIVPDDWETNDDEQLR
jgi:hypothetical protein